ncbi:xanthine dehydrogenase accessory protein XdhC [Marinomonas epiphytica]
MMSSLNWITALGQVEQSGQAWVMATVLGTQGSAPRESASKMLITAQHTYDTIGGGQLEYLVCQKARALLAHETPASHQIERFPLAAKTQQCCGGAVSVLLEYFAPPAMRISVFGMGHVASTLVNVLGNMPAKISWVDQRNNLAQQHQNAELPNNLELYIYDDMEQHVAQLEAGEVALIMTHDHALDYRLVEALLDRKDCRFIGLIGSQTKAMRFKKRLKSASFSETEIASVHCPVGLADVSGKQPFEIAISIAAQLVQLNQTSNESRKKRTGLSWQEIQHALLDVTG